MQLRPFPCETSPAWEAAWRDLERRSLLRNPFLSPSFLLPQSPEPANPQPVQLLTIIDGQGRWLLAGIFEQISGTRQLPLPHLRAARTSHSFKTGLMVDATLCESTVEVLWRFLRELNLHGLSFPLFPLQSSLALLLRERCEQERTAVVVEDVHSRAMTYGVDHDDESTMSVRRAKSLRRGRRELEKVGAVSLRFNGCEDGDLSSAERFLFLESLGWKGESQSALACRPHQVQAFKDIALGLAEQQRIQFAELAVDDRVIASMCLFRSENDYYAFKIGWDPQFERGCPGFLLAAEIQANLHRLPGCERIDSCASAGSFLDHVWPGRKEIGTALFTTTWWGSTAAQGSRWVRDRYRQLRGQPPSVGSHGETKLAQLPEHVGEVP